MCGKKKRVHALWQMETGGFTCLSPLWKMRMENLSQHLQTQEAGTEKELGL